MCNTYAAYNQNDAVRAESSSGAVFFAAAEYVISQKGIVYGVAMSMDCRQAEYARAADILGAARLRGSKYLQAKMGNTFQNVKEDLECGRTVLFTGTGCCINGLKMFLRKDYPNLICIDFICHGVPSPALWRKYVRHIEARHKLKLTSVNFRCKDKGWDSFGIKKLGAEGRAVYTSKNYDPYMQMFLKDLCLRPSCYACAAREVRRSDITIGDFWGIESVAPEMNDNRGVSLVLVRTMKGQGVFESICGSLEYRIVSYDEAVRGNPAEYRSPVRPSQRDTFFNDMNSMSFSALNRKYLPLTMKRKIKLLLIKTPARRFFGGGRLRSNSDYGMLVELRM